MMNDFEKALYLIATYKKAKNYNSAVLATRELLLKYKTSINYYEAVLKKLYSLETSNIDIVAKSATIKITKIKEILDNIQKRLSIIQKELKDTEALKQKNDEQIRMKVEKERIKFMT